MAQRTPSAVAAVLARSGVVMQPETGGPWRKAWRQAQRGVQRGRYRRTAVTNAPRPGSTWSRGHRVAQPSPTADVDDTPSGASDVTP